MLYRLAFRITSDGYLRVTGVAKDSPAISAIHLNDKLFAAAVKAAQMAPFQTLRLLEAAREARNQPAIEVCCEAVELNQKQIDELCLQPSKGKIA
jgi:hypothetical protein